MQDLKDALDRLLETLADGEAIRSRVESLVSVYPFNDYEFIISHLLARDVMSLDQYLGLRDNYRVRNEYLHLFEMSASTFGVSWAEDHLKEHAPVLLKSTKELDPNYSGQYDFLLDGKIRIEVKASRAVDSSLEAPLYVKALSSDSGKPFRMNFQQIKPDCFDVLVWIAVWRDVIRYWVLSTHEVKSNMHYSKGQHRGNKGEGQLHMNPENINKFSAYEITASKLAEALRRAYKTKVEKPG